VTYTYRSLANPAFRPSLDSLFSIRPSPLPLFPPAVVIVNAAQLRVVSQPRPLCGRFDLLWQLFQRSFPLLFFCLLVGSPHPRGWKILRAQSVPYFSSPQVKRFFLGFFPSVGLFFSRVQYTAFPALTGAACLAGSLFPRKDFSPTRAPRTRSLPFQFLLEHHVKGFFSVSSRDYSNFRQPSLFLLILFPDSFP